MHQLAFNSGPVPAVELMVGEDCLEDIFAVSSTAADRITRSHEIYDAFRFLANHARESFWAVYLNAKNQPLAALRVSTGTLTASLVHPREVFSPALQIATTAGIILVHNHPSGDHEPSPEDRAITDRLQACGELLGITILDHVVLSRNGYVSFKERGLL